MRSKFKVFLFEFVNGYLILFDFFFEGLNVALKEVVIVVLLFLGVYKEKLPIAFVTIHLFNQMILEIVASEPELLLRPSSAPLLLRGHIFRLIEGVERMLRHFMGAVVMKTPVIVTFLLFGRVDLRVWLIEVRRALNVLVRVGLAMKMAAMHFFFAT